MNDRLARQAGKAVLWRGVQLFGGKAISLARFFILARLLAPDDFGLLAIATVAMDTVLALTSLGISSALVHRDSVEKRHYDTGWTLSLVRGLLVAAVLVLWAPGIANLFAEPRATNFIRVLGLKPILDGVASIRLVDLTRNLSFQPLAWIRISSATVETVGTVLLVLIIPPLLVDAAVSVSLVQSVGAWALIAGAFAGSAMSVLLSYLLAPYRPGLRLDREAARQIVGFGKWIFFTHLVGVIGHVALRAVISRKLGAAELGLFYLALKLTVLPNDVVGEVIRSVAFPVVSRVKSDAARTRRAFQAGITAMFVTLVPIYAVMIALAGPLTSLLGEQWAALVPVVQLLALDGIVDVLADGMSPLLRGVGNPERQTLMKGVRTLVILAVVWPLTSMWGVSGAAAAWLVAEAVQSLVAVAMARATISSPFRGIRTRLMVIFATGAASGAVAWIVAQPLPSSMRMVIGAGAGLGVAVAAIIGLDRRFRFGMTTDFAAAFPAVAGRLGLVTDSD